MNTINTESTTTPPQPAPPVPAPTPGPPGSEGWLRLVALLSLLGTSAGLYLLADAAMSTVATAGTALFATRHNRGGGTG